MHKKQLSMFLEGDHTLNNETDMVSFPFYKFTDVIERDAIMLVYYIYALII